jgi:hypothetical protein
MNERIRELAREAGFYANPDIEKFEKFAELIVRECCDIVHSKTDESIRVVMAIEQHFGIEL